MVFGFTETHKNSHSSQVLAVQLVLQFSMVIPTDSNNAVVGVFNSLLTDPLSLLCDTELPQLRLRKTPSSYVQIFDVSANREFLFRGIGQMTAKRMMGHDMNLSDTVPVRLTLLINYLLLTRFCFSSGREI